MESDNATSESLTCSACGASCPREGAVITTPGNGQTWVSCGKCHEARPSKSNSNDVMAGMRLDVDALT